MAKAPGVAARELGEVGPTRCSIVVTDEPWAIGIDAIVLSVGRGGFGELGEAVRRATGFEADPEEMRELTADKPVIVRLPESSASSGTSLQHLILVTARDGEYEDDRPGSVDAAATAAGAAVRLAKDNGVRQLGMPLIGTGVLRMGVADVAMAIVPAVRAALAAATKTENTLTDVVFIAKEEATAKAIEAAWTEPDTGVQVRMLADAPIDDERFDLLGHRDYAAALAFVIDHPETGTPLTIAINAPWGAGKTSIAKLTEQRLDKNLVRSAKPPIVCWFNAWHHDDAPNIATALAAAVARAAARERSIWRRVTDPLPSALLTPHGRRRRYLITSVLGAALGLAAYVQSGAFSKLTGNRVSWSVAAALLPFVLRTTAAVRGTAADVGSLLRTPTAAFASGSIDEVRSDLGRLIHQATQRGQYHRPPHEHRRLVVFIDDLERCQPSRSIEVCETVSHLLSHEDVVVVLIGDMQTLATAAETKYKDLAPRYRTGLLPETADALAGSFGEMYLEKIIQFRFDVPADPAGGFVKLVAQLVGHTVEKGAPPTGGVITWLWSPLQARWRQRKRDHMATRVRRSLSKTTAAPPADTGTDTQAGEYTEDGIRQDLLATQRLLRQIEGPYLDRSYAAIAAHVRPLPRDVKRILNRIRFTLYLGMRRELLAPAGPISAAGIGKWSLLAERWPDLAVAVSNDPKLLAQVEDDATSEERFVKGMAGVVPGYANRAELMRLLNATPSLAPNAVVLARFAKETTSDVGEHPLDALIGAEAEVADEGSE
jgi:hypothetical protein